MRRVWSFLLVTILVVVPSCSEFARGQDVPLEVPGAKVVKVQKLVPVEEDQLIAPALPFPVKAQAVEGARYEWTVPPGVYAVPNANVLEIRAAPKGPLIVDLQVVTFDGGFKYKKGKVIVNIGEPGPTPPVPPIPPGPTPPTPPAPPIPVGGLRVLFVCESSSNLTREQLNIWNSTRIADYLNRKTAKDDNRPGWRKWDKDANKDNEHDTWKKLWAATQPSLGQLPAVVIVNDQKGQVFPLPATEDETLALLKKFGGD